METCEICGKNAEKIYLARIEEANMWVCAACSKGKKIIQTIDSTKRPKKAGIAAADEEEDIADHFGDRIRKARETLGLPLAVLAERISEQESTLKRIEKEKGLPSDTLRKKLEKELGIKLTEKGGGDNRMQGLGRREPITLGDAAFKKGAKQEDEE